MGGARRSFLTVLLLFGGNGLQAGIYTLLIADVAQALRLDAGSLGIALAALSAGCAAGVMLFGRLADRWGRRPVLLVGCVGGGAFFVALGQVDRYPILLVTMAAGGFVMSAFDLSPTTIGGDYEREHGAASMNPFFAGQDVGGAIGAASCGLALAAGVHYSVLYSILGAVLVALGVAALYLPLPTPGHEDAAHPDAAHTGHQETGAGEQPTGRLLSRGVVLAAAFVALISLVDAAMEGYSSVYLRDTLESGPAVAGIAIAVSLLASGAGRLTGAALLRRHGEGALLVASGIAAAAGVLVLVATGLPVVAALGLLLLRFCQAPIVPVAYSLAARSTPGRAGQSASVAWASLYLAFLTGPLIVGGVSELVGLRGALAGFAMAGATIAVLAVTLARPVLLPGDRPEARTGAVTPRR